MQIIRTSNRIWPKFGLKFVTVCVEIMINTNQRKYQRRNLKERRKNQLIVLIIEIIIIILMIIMIIWILAQSFASKIALSVNMRYTGAWTGNCPRRGTSQCQLTDSNEVVVTDDRRQLVVPIESRAAAGQTHLVRLRGHQVDRWRVALVPLGFVVSPQSFLGKPSDGLGALARHRQPLVVDMRR